jgi:hypothetical protein
MIRERRRSGILPKIREPNGREKRPSRSRSGDVLAIYVMEAGIHVKIGMSRAPAVRAGSMQPGNAADISTAWVARGAAADIKRLEAAVHRKLRGTADHVRGEWYSMSAQRAAKTITRMARELGVCVSSGEFNNAPGRLWGWHNADTHIYR